MLFSSIIFLFYFLPIVLAVYFAIPKRYLRARNVVLLIASLFFYSWGEPVYLFLMIYSIFFNYFMAIQIYNEQHRGGSGKRNLVFTLIVNLFILGFFKYFGFLMDTVNGVFGLHIKYTALSLPIGISFYTFQAMSYILDVYRKTVRPQPNPLKFGLYLSLFPQLIAGPIVKYRDVAEQLQYRETTKEKFGQGAIRFMFGLGKKVMLANYFGALNSSITGLADSKSAVVTAWIGAVAYTLQIYFDFSGYSDMAIGLGKMFGFDFLENFNYPYISRSVTDFWRRWHMSLSGWFREYVYIPLGGNRVTVPRHILNLMIVWGLTGLWHGAAWNFVFWGLYYGVLLVLEKYIWGKYIDWAPVWLQHVYAMVIVIIGWVFFSSATLGKAFDIIGMMFGIGAPAFINMHTLYLLRTNILLLIGGCLMSSPKPMEKFRELESRFPVLGLICVFSILILSTACLIYSSYNPFLYFRF